MRTLAVFSGKGGTGKTTLVASFARLAREAVVVDCDVDAANIHLLLPGEDILKEPFHAGRKALIDPRSCLGCGACYRVCRFDAITPMGHLCQVEELACEGCGACALVCPSPDTIVFRSNQAGHWMRRRSDGLLVVHAALGIAQDNSGKLVAKVREEGERWAKEDGVGLVLVDGAPGIGCPVHAAMSRVDRVLVVTEPSTSGRHDMERLLGLAAHFRIPCCVVINKWDLVPRATEEVERASAAMGVPVAGRVPFDRAVPTLLASGRLPLAPPAQPETTEAIQAAWLAFATGPVAIPEMPAGE